MSGGLSSQVAWQVKWVVKSGRLASQVGWHVRRADKEVGNANLDLVLLSLFLPDSSDCSCM